MIGSFLNLDRIVHEIIRMKLPVELVCAGTRGEFSLDDFLFAGAVASNLERAVSIQGTDLTMLAISAWKQAEPDLHSTLESCTHYRYLKKLGFTKDLAYCFNLNLHPVLPLLQTESGKIVLIK